jgi:hypothetical protein
MIQITLANGYGAFNIETLYVVLWRLSCLDVCFVLFKKNIYI